MGISPPILLRTFRYSHPRPMTAFNDVFLPRDASAERGNATVSRPSVCPSVRLSVCL